MRRTIQDSVSIQVGSESMRVRHLIRHALRADVRFNSNFEGIRIAMRIEDACKSEVIGDAVYLDEGDWEKLCDSLKSPSPLNSMSAYPTAPAHASFPLLDLVFEAVKES